MGTADEETKKEIDRLLESYSVYYDIERESPAPPFLAEAVCSVKNEQYLLFKSARISEAEAGEIVFFAAEDELDEEKARELAEKSWEIGLSKVNVTEHHRNTDVVLVVVCRTMTDGAAKYIKKKRFYKSYSFGLKGWSAYRLAAFAQADGRFAANRMGTDLKKLFPGAV